MKTILSAVYNLVASMNPAVKVVLGLGSMLLALAGWVRDLWASLFAKIDGMAQASYGGADFSPLGFVNYVFPLDTVLTFLVAYGALKLACAGIRIIKSFIPTVA